MENQTKKRVAVYVDGFNLYYAMRNLLRQRPKLEKDHSIKWLDLTELAKGLISSSHKIVSVNYFSATRNEYALRLSGEIIKSAKKEKTCAHRKRINKEILLISEESKRHIAYIEALRNKNIMCDISEFGWNRIKCRYCGKHYTKPKEKQTDVKIALRIVSDAYENKFDSLLLISEDSDFFPVTESIITEHNKEVFVAVGSSVVKRLSEKMKRQEKFPYEKVTILPFTESLLQQCQLPDVIPLANGEEIRRPDKYRRLQSPSASSAAS